MVARDRGALGLVLVSGPRSGAREPLVPLQFDAALGATSLLAISASDAFGDSLLAGSGHTLGELQAALWHLPSGDRLPYFRDRCRGAWSRCVVVAQRVLPGMADQAKRGLLETRMTCLDLQARYVVEPYSGSIELIRAELLTAHATLEDPLLGWQELAAGGTTITDIAGSHVTILQKPNVAKLADRLQELMRQAEAQA